MHGGLTWGLFCYRLRDQTDLAFRGIIGPALVHNGAAFGDLVDKTDPKWDSYYSFASLRAARSNKYTPSPRFWLLWPGVLCMIAVSFTGMYPLTIC